MAAKKRKTTDTRFTKTQIADHIAEETGLSRADVNRVFDSLADVIQLHINKRSIGDFVLPGLLKVQTVKKPARKAQKNVPNPFRPGEMMDVAAKPASTTVKVRPLKKLKDMAN